MLLKFGEKEEETIEGWFMLKAKRKFREKYKATDPKPQIKVSIDVDRDVKPPPIQVCSSLTPAPRRREGERRKRC